ncbi:F-box domain-containing protein [Colletotrichum truncatum]|uniref:F-box domain-containing protein n=1 Tax=Colletotrichum truncatum TaxID=5467 RepID=A0ACC3Z2S2_COLTU
MLKRGGWWSSIESILGLELPYPQRKRFLDEGWTMSKWLARECTLGPYSSRPDPAFVEIGRTKLTQLGTYCAARMLPDNAYRLVVSVCGQFLMVIHGCIIQVYELNHTCNHLRYDSSTSHLRKSSKNTRGLLYPVTKLSFTSQVISCAMDTSQGRYAIAVLLEGQTGIICNLATYGTPSRNASRLQTSILGHIDDESSSPSKSPSPETCVCQIRPELQPPPLETGSRTRECVAFGSASAIEIHWVDGPTGEDLVRRFPLSTPSDFLYFLPPRLAIDSSKKLRLISSATVVESTSDQTQNSVRAFSHASRGYPQEIPAVISRLETSVAGRENNISNVYTITEQLVGGPTAIPSYRTAWVRRRPRSISTIPTDNYRAVPLSDGYHILFTDPQTGYLCLGADAPFGSLTRLQRKVQFRPPSAATSDAPTTYVVGADLKHGVRIAAVFPTTQWTEGAGYKSEKQLIVFYTIPPDMFQDISFFGNLDNADRPVADWAQWWPTLTVKGSNNLETTRPVTGLSYPLDVQCQVVTACSGVFELSIDAGPDLIVWAFSVDGWGRCWALNTGQGKQMIRSSVQQDGSLRRIDGDGDVMIPDVGYAT